MLIEASRGGHTNVANLLLRQPRENSPSSTPPPASPPLASRHSVLEHQQQQAGLQHNSNTGRAATLPSGTKGSGRNGCGSGAVGQESGKSAKNSNLVVGVHNSGTVGQDSGKVVKSRGRIEAAAKELVGGDRLMVEEIPITAARPLPKERSSGPKLGKSVVDPEATITDVSQAKRQKVLPSSEAISAIPNISVEQSCEVGNGPILPTSWSASSSPSKAAPPAHPVTYATDSATAMQNVQQWASIGTTAGFLPSAGNPASIVVSSGGTTTTTTAHHIGSSVDVPTPDDSSPDNPVSTAIQQYAQLTPDDIILGHMTANDLLQGGHVTAAAAADEVVARHKNSSDPSRSTAGTNPSQQQQQQQQSELENAQNLFSSGNFNNQLQSLLPSANKRSVTVSVSGSEPAKSNHPSSLSSSRVVSENTRDGSNGGSTSSHTAESRVGACEGGTTTSSSSTTSQAGNASSRRMAHSSSLGPNATSSTTSTMTASESLESSSTFPNMDLRRLIPHLEALADLLQNPASLDSHCAPTTSTMTTTPTISASNTAPLSPPSLLSSATSKLSQQPFVTSSVVSDDGSGGVSTLPSSSEEPPLLPYNTGPTSTSALPSNLESLAAIAAHMGHLDLSSPPSSLSGGSSKSSSGSSNIKGLTGAAFEVLATLASQSLPPDDKSSTTPGLDISSLLSNTDLSKLLPTLATMEAQRQVGSGSSGYGGGVGGRMGGVRAGYKGNQGDSNLKPVPITDPDAVRELWEDMLMVRSNPGYVSSENGGGGKSGSGISNSGTADPDASVPPQLQDAHYVKQKLQKHYQQQLPGNGGGVAPSGTAARLPKRTHSLNNNSFMLDGNFHTDLPHVQEVVHGGGSEVPGSAGNKVSLGLPSGYEVGGGESYPSSDEEGEGEGVDDEDNGEDEDGDDDRDMEDEESGELLLKEGHL